MNARTGTAETWRDALALATLLRDCAASGVERRALHLRLSALPRDGREDRHRHLLREAMAPVLRPTRARLFILPDGDLVALSPPPGEHLAEARERRWPASCPKRCSTPMPPCCGFPPRPQRC